MPEKNSKPNVEEIVDFSVCYVCDLFGTNTDLRGVFHGTLTLGGERALANRFSLRDSVAGVYSSRRLFFPTYYILLDDYFIIDGFPNGGGDPKSNEHYWRLNSKPLDRETLKRKIFGKYRKYLESNLEQCFVD